MMFNSTVNNHNTVKWRNNLSDMSDHDDDLDNELPLSSISDFELPIGNNTITRSHIEKYKSVDYQQINDESKKYETVDHQIELDMNQDDELPLSSIADFLRPIDHKLQNSELQKCETVDYQTEENNDKKDELPLSSIADFLRPIDHKLQNSELQKCETVDYQTEENNDKKDELTLSSIADFLCPIDHKLQNSELQKCETVDYQTEENNNKKDKLILSSIADFPDPFDKKFIKHEAVDCQSKENINHYNKSEPNRLICNKELSSIIMDNPSKEYKCDICGKIFSKRTDIINHFKISLCFPDIVPSPSTPITSVDVERLFSTYKTILSNNRRSLYLNTSENI